MYSAENLARYPFFEKLLQKEGLNNVLDSLTGLVARKPFETFIRDLTDKRIPFTMGMLDLDNFKYVNDHYGHSAGDSVLKEVADNMIDFFKEDGVVARFGGDEFLFIILGERTYDEVHAVFTDMFACEKIVRRVVNVGGADVFVTATCGSTSFPKDADTYDELFSKADKTLYRGKNKGKNCYIIYVESMLGTIDVKKLAAEDLYTMFVNVEQRFTQAETLSDKIRGPVIYMKEAGKIQKIFYVDKEYNFLDPETDEVFLKFVEIGDLIKGEQLIRQDDVHKDERFRVFNDTMRIYGIYSYMICRINYKDEVYGYVMFADRRSTRMWQKDEKALIFYYSKLLANYFAANEGKR